MTQVDPTTCRLLITAGPTHEPIDAVRYLANRSSGRLGTALAAEAALRGFPGTLLLGPAAVEPPEFTRIEVARFRTTEDLKAELARRWPAHDVLVMAAAVADYRPAGRSEGKTPRRDRPLTIELEPTPDLLAELAALKRPDQTVIGFALEPAGRILESARDKLRRKRLDAIVANPLATMGAGEISATLLLRNGEVREAPPAISKSAFAAWLLDQLPAIRGQSPRESLDQAPNASTK